MKTENHSDAVSENAPVMRSVTGKWLQQVRPRKGRPRGAIEIPKAMFIAAAIGVCGTVTAIQPVYAATPDHAHASAGPTVAPAAPLPLPKPDPDAKAASSYPASGPLAQGYDDLGSDAPCH